MQTGLKRELNLLDLTMLGLGAIIGSGWLFASQKAGNMAGPAAILSWLIGGIAVIFIALVYAELGSMLPEAGGLVRYPQYSHGTFVGYIMGFACIIAYSTVISIEAEAVVQYMSSYIPVLFNGKVMTFSRWLVSLVLIVLFFLLNYYSVRLFAKVNTVITLLKFITPVLTVIVLLTQFHGANLVSRGFAPFGLPGVLSAVSSGGIVFAFLGFRQAVDMAGEAKNPQRNVPLAIILAILLGVVLYAVLQTTFIGAIPAAKMAAGWGQINFRSPFADLALLLGFNWLATILFADAILSPAGTGNIYTASTSRVVLAQANNGFWWRIFKNVDGVSGVPRPALWLTLILAVIWTAPFPAWNKLVGVVSGAVVFTYMIGPVSALSLRRVAPDLHRPLPVKGLPVIALLAFIVGTLLIYWNGWSTDWVVVVVDLLGLLLYAGFVIARADLRTDLAKNIKAGIWLVVYMFFLLAVSYAGSKQFGGHNLIKYPEDMLVVIIGAIVFFYWGNASAMRTEEIENAVADQVKAQEYLNKELTHSA
ncbi:APC family permease [Desulfotomaculum copahuensis]|uniref:Aspartate:proton symporter n=1 Tax=Desulfotomaculum copahuensis TaxID=1838280 RepID=A0A1B7LGU8_9FIRM|nr:APC family permease [Desulfotomaculum copahuensis]OAT85425.1 aspartate:proton symporter [Desulfotomaculum copahuensis]